MTNRVPLKEHRLAAWWEPVAEPGQMGFILFHRAPLTPKEIALNRRANYWLVHDFQDKLWLVRAQEKELRDAGYETFVARTVALPFDPSYAGVYVVPETGVFRDTDCPGATIGG